MKPSERTKMHRDAWIAAHGPCVYCYGTDNLEVDHVERKNKTIRTRDIWRLGQTRREAELKHCQVLCRQCHILKTAQDNGHWPLSIEDVDLFWKLKKLGLKEKRLAGALGISVSRARNLLEGMSYRRGEN